MEGMRLVKNIANTGMVIGLSLSVASARTDTVLISGNEYPIVKYIDYERLHGFQVNSSNIKNIDNIYIQHKNRKIDLVANELFGVMRDATNEERASVDKYIKSISRSTGVNFFDLC